MKVVLMGLICDCVGLNAIWELLCYIALDIRNFLPFYSVLFVVRDINYLNVIMPR